MLVALFILSYISQGWTRATPYLESSASVLAHNATSLAPLVCTCPDQRSVSDIVWSCLATLFACSWVSVHPDIPTQGEKWWSNILQRVEFMSWTILSPEFVITWAGRQWIGARRIAREQNWTVTHGHFLQMGGFMLYKGEEKKGVLSYNRFKELLRNKRIEFPRVTQEEIEDRSKSDGLCKTLVIGQTTWFILQCLARRFKHLPITELELATLAFAALNGFMYFCWWDKPFDVRIPISVHLLPEDNTKRNLSAEIDGVEETWSSGLSVSRDLNIKKSQNNSSRLLRKSMAYIKSWSSLIVEIFNVRLDAINDLQFVAQFAAFNDPARPEDDSGPMQVPAFYALLATSEEYNKLFLAVSTTGTVFGAIHCAGWFFHFPTRIESWVWRACSLALVAGPILLLFVSYEPLNQYFRHSRFTIFSAFGEFFANDRVIRPVGWIFYIITRLALFAECFAALRSLPPGAHSVVQWPLFLPHI